MKIIPISRITTHLLIPNPGVNQILRCAAVFRTRALKLIFWAAIRCPDNSSLSIFRQRIVI